MNAPMIFDLPQGRILPLDSVSVRLLPGPHPFELANREAIDVNWQSEHAANPALFDGTVVLLSRLQWREGAITGACHAVRYATFLYWRRMRPVPAAGHIHACAIPVTSDGAIIAIRMAAHTANAGIVYFAAGTFEPTDFVDGLADLAGNARRELAEETGIDLAGLPIEPRFSMLSLVTGTAVFRRVRLPWDAREACARIEAHVAAEAQSEIDGPVVIRDVADLPAHCGLHMPHVVRWHLANPL